MMPDLVFSESEQKTIIEKIWRVLERQAGRYNGCDSTSMTVEKAQSLLESILYTIEFMICEGTAPKEILDGDMEFLIRKGQELLKKKCQDTKIEWKLMCRTLPQIPNVYFLSTIRNLGIFFERYDLYYGAHLIPCSIDYWPMHPVSERLKGISYMEEYIRRLQMENDLLNWFERKDVISLYKKYVPDYTEDLFNLCEPVLTNAIGLELIGQDIRRLHISAAGQAHIYQMLAHRPGDEVHMALEKAAGSVCRKMGMHEQREQEYLVSTVSGLSARVCEALKYQDLSNIFINGE